MIRRHTATNRQIDTRDPIVALNDSLDESASLATHKTVEQIAASLGRSGHSGYYRGRWYTDKLQLAHAVLKGGSTAEELSRGIRFGV